MTLTRICEGSGAEVPDDNSQCCVCLRDVEVLKENGRRVTKFHTVTKDQSLDEELDAIAEVIGLKW